MAGGPEAGPAFVSKDGAKTYVVAVYKSHGDPDATTEHLREKLAEVDGVQVGGFGPAYQQVNEQVESDLVKAELIAFPLLFLVSLWVFRSAVAALLPLLVGGLTIVGSLLVVRGINEVVDISIFALNLITGLGPGSRDRLLAVPRLALSRRARPHRARAPRRSDVPSPPPVVPSPSRPSPSPAPDSRCWCSRCASSTRWASACSIVSLMAAAVSLIVLPSLFAVLQHRVNAGSPKRWQRAQAAEIAAEAARLLVPALAVRHAVPGGDRAHRNGRSCWPSAHRSSA